MKFLSVIPLVLAAVHASTELAPRACTPFLSAVTGLQSCCDQTANTLYVLDKILNLGVCCAFGTILDGLSCTAPPAPPAAGVCSGTPVCPSKPGQDLGITYGHCYVLQSVSNMYLGHDSATKYVIDGENPGVVFRVCGDLANCTTNAGKLVGVNSTWYMQDQFGDPNGSGFGWLGGTGDLTVQDTTAGALVVGGSEICYGGKCAVCISFPPGGAHAPCPLQPGQSHLGIANNPNSCQPFLWQEVACRSEQ